MDSIQMSERSNYIGEWWIPRHKKSKLVGQCTFDPSGSIQLSLEGYFEQQNFDTVFGYASGRKITLLDCFETATGMFATKAIIDTHIGDEKKIYIKEIEIETTDIIPWSYLSGINRGNIVRLSSKTQNKMRFEVTYESKEPIKIYKNSDVEVTLNSSSIDMPFVHTPSHEFIIKERNYFKIFNNTYKKGLFMIEYADIIRKFISIATRNNIGLQSIKLNFEEKDGFAFAYILMPFIPIDIDHKAKSISKRDMFFILPDVESRIIDLFGRWLNSYRKMPEVYNLYFYGSGGIPYKIFLSTAQALEAFHMRTKIRSKKWSFKNRISNLFDRFSRIMNHTGDKESFAQLMLDHRDYFTHWLQKKKAKVFYDARLQYLARDANLLLEMCFISEMGFDDSEVINLINKNYYYNYYIQSPERVKWCPGMP